MVKQPGHLTSMKKERGSGTRVFSLCFLTSAEGAGLRRSIARTCEGVLVCVVGKGRMCLVVNGFVPL
jgi:hypothetical protein